MAFDDFKNKKKSVWSNVFWYTKVCTFWYCIQYFIHWDKRQMLKKFASNKINGTKNALFFLSRAQTHQSFTFNLRFLYELKYKGRHSEIVCRIFHFRFHFVFTQIYISVQKSKALWLSNVIIPFKIKTIEKPHLVLLPDLWFLSYNKKATCFKSLQLNYWEIN